MVLGFVSNKLAHRIRELDTSGRLSGSEVSEVEVKYLPKESNEQRLLAEAVFLKEQILEDTHYDTQDFPLTRSDRLLRLHNSTLETKLGRKGSAERALLLCFQQALTRR